MTSPNTPPSGQPDPAALLALGLATQAADGTTSAAPPLTPAELAAEFPRLDIVELLGRGGMGAVYKARQRDLDRLVALKILRPGLDADPGFAERFTREARALAQLNHPGIVTLYEFGKTSAGRYFILMEFVDGMNLRQLLAAGRLSPREALAIVPPLCDALQYAHDRGLIHRDIKPENLLIDRLGRIKIADFGIARLASEGRDGPPGRPSENPTFSEVAGTPAYMAPEQRDHPAAVDHRADLYALGVVLYQMLTGELPAAGQLRPPSTRVQLDVRLDEIVLRALEKDPARRYAAASDFKTQIETVANSAPLPAPGSSPSPNRSRRTPLFTALTIAAACVALFATASLLLNRTADESGFSTIPKFTDVANSPPPSIEPPASGMLFMTDFGEFKSDLSPWSVRVSSQDRKLHISRKMSLGGTGMSPSAWRAKEGWFVFLENEERAWAFDGDRDLLMVQITPEGTTLYDIASVPLPVPEPVLSRLSETARNLLAARPMPTINPSLLAQTPQLRALNWWDHVQNNVGQSWLPGGEHFTEDRKLPLPAGILDESKPDARFLTLWFSHPLFDRQSVGTITLLNAQDQTPLKQPTKASSVRQYPPDQTTDEGWLIANVSPATFETSPASVIVQLRYTLGPWTSAGQLPIKTNYSEIMTDGTALSSPAQDAEGKAFVEANRKPRTGEEQQLDFVAVTHDQRRLKSTGKTVSSYDGFTTERFQFDVPLAQIRVFEIRTRPFRSATFNVKLHPEMPPGTELLGVVNTAQQWLQIIDKGAFAQSWHEAAASFKASLNEAAWTAALQSVRPALGATNARRLRSAVPMSRLPGAPDGRYLVMTFATEFTQKKESVETVTFSLEPDGQWRASGYFIR